MAIMIHHVRMFCWNIKKQFFLPSCIFYKTFYLYTIRHKKVAFCFSRHLLVIIFSSMLIAKFIYLLEICCCMSIVLFLSLEQRDRGGRGCSSQQQSIVLCLKIGRTLSILGALGEPLGSSARFPQPNLVGAYPDTQLSLLDLLSGDVGLCVAPVGT